MLHKLAAAAAWLDAHDLFAESNLLTGVFLRVATSLVSEDGTDSDSPEHDFKSPTYHDSEEFDAGSTDFLGTMEKNHPEGYAWWTKKLKDHDPKFDPSVGYTPEQHTHTHHLGGRRMRVPRGFSGMTAPEAAHFIRNTKQQAQGEALFSGKFQGLTKGGTANATYELDYPSMSKPKSEDPEALKKQWSPQSYTYSKRLVDIVGREWERKKAEVEATGKPYNVADPRLNKMVAFNTKVLRQIFDPSDVSEEAEALRKKMDESKLSVAQRLGYALRASMVPGNVLGMMRYKRPKDPLTGLPVENFYPDITDGFQE